ncbi:MAG TPA: T9SS type A sorting domain-containing protein [Catalimonadaceae bacterium]|nr:T9SS type A sorting domain-containing protein [Catalimonadaceae bacterium]
MDGGEVGMRNHLLWAMAVAPEGSSVTNIIPFENESGNQAILGDVVPNPATDQLIIPIFIPANSNETYQLSIFSLDGKANQMKHLIFGKGALQPQFSVQSLPAGVYGYSFSESGKIIGTRKLVVIK